MSVRGVGDIAQLKCSIHEFQHICKPTEDNAADQTRPDHSLVTLANHCLDLALVGGVDVISVLGSHQHGSVLKGGALHVCPLALYDCGGQDGHHMAGETCDVARHPHKHPCCTLHKTQLKVTRLRRKQSKQ